MKHTKESRRTFLKNVAGASAVALTSPLSMVAAQSPQQPTAPPQTPPTTPTQAQLLGEIVRQRYGQYLTPDQFSSVLTSLDAALQRARRLREFTLNNSDEPDMIFRVLE